MKKIEYTTKYPWSRNNWSQLKNILNSVFLFRDLGVSEIRIFECKKVINKITALVNLKVEDEVTEENVIVHVLKD